MADTDRTKQPRTAQKMPKQPDKKLVTNEQTEANTTKAKIITWPFPPSGLASGLLYNSRGPHKSGLH